MSGTQRLRNFTFLKQMVMPFEDSFWKLLLIISLRYLIVASVAFAIFYLFRKKVWQHKKIQLRFPAHSDYYREIIYSIITAFIFAAVGYLTFLTAFVQYTQTYFNIGDYGWGYFALSVVMMIVFHDTYFYWMHWLMHRPAVFRWVHKVHHLSTNPSPWAAMAFHPIEAVFEALIITVIAVAFPVHPMAIAIFLLFMMLYNVYGHLGYELYPRGFAASAIGRWINTSVNHNQHHQHFTGNYGLYFLWWDRWMGTLRSDYDTKFEEVTARYSNKAAGKV